jgi:hypothetical protein
MGKSSMRKSYHFIEVGTSDFDSIIEQVNDTIVGLSIEPHKTYLERLPDKNNVTKVNAALVSDKAYKNLQNLDFYYVDEKTIHTHNLGHWVKGCNSIGKPHDLHLSWYHDPVVWHATKDKSTLKTVNLLEQGLVSIEKVECLTFSMLAKQFNIGKIQFLKTDTEGQDATLLESVLNYYIKNNLLDMLPSRIMFETNSHSVPEEVASVKKIMFDLGYNIETNINDSYATLGSELTPYENISTWINLLNS